MIQSLLAGLSPNVLPIICVIALFIGGAIMIVAASTRERGEQLDRRVAMVQSATGATGRAALRQAPEESRRSAAAHGLTDGEHRQILRLFSRYSTSADVALVYFTVSRIVLASLAGGLAMLLVSTRSIWLTVLIALAAAAFGWFLPMKLVRWKLQRHADQVGSGLPGGLELLAICVEAGLSLETGLQRVARELKGAQPALADELALTWAEITILPSRDQALANLAERINLPSVRSVVGTLAQSMRYGSPLAQSLRNAAEEMRGEQLMALEERANRLPALMTVPVMLLIMPTIFLIVGGPAILRLIDIFTGPK
ncbi:MULTISPECIES: type II secretion system F family protein [Rhodomicrobium]|uniref:type II secretion system F family protein n=1 Tax=Rhodomicrobium TaxID=1068 RepID=UPI000B4BA0C1|nr:MULTISPECIES: type II secretion system F family protein [Rhodomicrobium]